MIRGPIWLDNRSTGQWKWMEEVQRRTSLAPLASPCFMLSLLSLETEGLLAFQARAGIASIVRWNLCPVIFGVYWCRDQGCSCRTHPSSIENVQISKRCWVEGKGILAFNIAMEGVMVNCFCRASCEWWWRRKAQYGQSESCNLSSVGHSAVHCMAYTSQFMS